jgi:predicted SAM-dependent methyltransferase
MILHVGCGPIYIPGMTNVDIGTHFKTDVCGNVLELDFPQNSVEMIWSCHFLEHLEYPQGVVKCLALFNKWLKKGGLLRLAVPDLEKIAKYYVNKDKTLFEIYGNSVDDRYYKKNSRAERFMFFSRAWEHTILFDFELLSELLVDAKFVNVTKRESGKSKLGSWSHDRMQLETLYIEAEKPL